MGLKDIIANAAKTPSFEEVQESVRLQIQEALSGKEPVEVVEIPVPWDHSEELRTWVEGEGVRCGLNKSSGKKAWLVISLFREPPKAKEFFPVLEIAEASHLEVLEQRIASLEEALATSSGGN